MLGVSGGGEGPSPEKAGGVQAPSSQRGCAPTLRVSGEPGRGWGRPHDHGRGSTWASQVGSRPGQTVEAGGGREEPGQPVCGLGPPRGHAVLDVDLSPELPSKPPHPPDPFSVLLLGMLPGQEFRGAALEPQPGSCCPGQMGLLLGGGAAPQPDAHTPHGGWGPSYVPASGRPPPHPMQSSLAVGLGLAAPCPLSTESAGEPAPPGMAFTSQGTAQRRKATGPGGAWGRSRPCEPLKAEFCTC